MMKPINTIVEKLCMIQTILLVSYIISLDEDNICLAKLNEKIFTFLQLLLKDWGFENPWYEMY